MKIYLNMKIPKEICDNKNKFNGNIIDFVNDNNDNNNDFIINDKEYERILNELKKDEICEDWIKEIK